MKEWHEHMHLVTKSVHEMIPLSAIRHDTMGIEYFVEKARLLL